MLEKVNHIAIAVPNLSKAILNYKKTFNCDISKPLQLIDHGVTTAFITLQNTNIELLVFQEFKYLEPQLRLVSL